MANQFLSIDQFTSKSTLTGTEEFQVSATEKVTAQQIANLFDAMQAKMAGLTALTVGMPSITSDSTILSAIQALYKLSGNGKVLTVSDPSLGKFGFVSFTANAAAGVLFHLNDGSVKTTKMYVNSTGMTGGDSRTDAQWISWLEDGTVIDLSSNNALQVVEITDFAIPGLNITKDGESFLFYANDASNIPNSNHGATSFVGVAIASPIFITGDQSLLYYMMIDTAKAMFYTGYCDTSSDTVTWSDTPVTRLGQAVQVTAFTESALSSLLYTYKAGDFIPFYTGNVTASTDNQFPESGIFNGFISMGSNEGDYFQIFAFKSGSNEAYLGACIGSTTQWTQIGDSGSSSGGLELVNTTYPITVGDGSEIALPGVTTSDHLMINLQVVKTSDVKIWPTGSFCLHCPIPINSGPYRLLDIYQFDEGIEAEINIWYVTESTEAVTVMFTDDNNVNADFVATIHAIYKLPE